MPSPSTSFQHLPAGTGYGAAAAPCLALPHLSSTIWGTGRPRAQHTHPPQGNQPFHHSVTIGTEHQVTLSLTARFDPALAGCGSSRGGLGRLAHLHPDTPAHSGQGGHGGPSLQKPPPRGQALCSVHKRLHSCQTSLVSALRSPFQAYKPACLVCLPASDKAKPCPKPTENSPPRITMPF